MTLSLAIHLVLIAILSVLIFEPKVLGFVIVTDVCSMGDEPEVESLDLASVPIEVSNRDNNSQMLTATEPISLGNSVDDLSIAMPDSTRLHSGTAGTEIGVPNVSARFSSVAAGRLKRSAKAKDGDYEIALFWDGPSDLDLHVRYRSPTGNHRRTINYITPGSPNLGYLDLDQNCMDPFTDEPIEHVRWNTKTPPPGIYQVAVHGFGLRSRRGRLPKSVEYTVEIKTPEGVTTHHGSVGLHEFDEVEVLVIGLTRQQRALLESQADRLLADAKEQLASDDERLRTLARGILKNIDRRFPSSNAAKEARELLQRNR